MKASLETSRSALRASSGRVHRRLIATSLCVAALGSALPLAAQAGPAQAGLLVDAGAAQGPAHEPTKNDAALPAGHEPQLRIELSPKDSVSTGELVQLRITASVVHGDDITIPDQSFAPFEVHKKNLRVAEAAHGKQDFVFDLQLLALTPGKAPIPAIELRVVTKDGFVGSAKTEVLPYTVRSLLANEPNAQPKPETKPVSVMQDNYIPLYIAGALLFALLIAGLTLLVSRYLRKRRARALPPPPPRPPFDIAAEKLAELRRKKQQMLQDGEGGVFVDQVSDVLREYLGGRYAFDGLETTTDEMIALLKHRGASLQLTQEVFSFLSRCDLVKFAKVTPDQDEADLIFAKASELVYGSREPKPVDVARAVSPAPGQDQGAP
jgi:hypothetical protein